MYSGYSGKQFALHYSYQNKKKLSKTAYYFKKIFNDGNKYRTDTTYKIDFSDKKKKSKKSKIRRFK